MLDKSAAEPLGLTIPEFCALARIGQTTAFKMIKLGNLRATKVGRRTIIAMAEARRFVAGQPKE